MSESDSILRYLNTITAAFDRLGFTPRPGQVEAVNRILEAFLERGMKNVVLCAPTGAGKSIIGMVTAEALTTINGRDEGALKSSVLLTATNVLARQYHNAFYSLSETSKFIMIKGANNYYCSALSTSEEAATGETCAFSTMISNKEDFQEILSQHCDACEYLRIKKQRNLIRHLATNYSYYFVDRLYTANLDPRDLIVWDEAHLINDLFSEHNAIYFSQKLVEKMAQEIASVVHITDTEIAKILSNVAADCATPGKINEKNFHAYLNAMLKVYKYATQRGASAQEKALRAGQMSTYNKLTRFVRAYDGRACKINDFFKYEYDHIFEHREEDAAVSVKPIFVGAMMEKLHCGERNLFMSATAAGDFMIKTCHLDPARTEFIKLPPTFPKENKEIIIFDPLSLNYSSLQNPALVKKLVENVGKIIHKHVSDGHRGIILTPSFKLQAAIVDGLPKAGYKLFEQRQGEKLEHALSAFKEYQAGPAVLISPSLFEGIDLPGDLSRFQVLVKAPFPSLGDKRMKYIADKWPELYSQITIMKAVQGAGRSVRSVTDKATTYILDQNLVRLWKSRQNVWADEFHTRYTSFL